MSSKPHSAALTSASHASERCEQVQEKATLLKPADNKSAAKDGCKIPAKRGGCPPPKIRLIALILLRVVLLDGYCAVIVAVIATRAVQVSSDYVVGVVAVRNSFVAASSTMFVSFIVRGAIMGRCAR